MSGIFGHNSVGATHETTIVNRACDGGRTAATIPPVALATFGATIGRSHAGETVLSVEACWWRVKTKNLRVERKSARTFSLNNEEDTHGTPIAMITEIAASTHHSDQASQIHLKKREVSDLREMGRTSVEIQLLTFRPIAQRRRRPSC